MRLNKTWGFGLAILPIALVLAHLAITYAHAQRVLGQAGFSQVSCVRVYFYRSGYMSAAAMDFQCTDKSGDTSTAVALLFPHMYSVVYEVPR